MSRFVRILRATIHDLAAIAGIGAFAFVVYGFAFPASISNYLDEVYEQTRLSNDILRSIGQDSRSIAEGTEDIVDNTGRLAGEIPNNLDITRAYNRSDPYNDLNVNGIFIDNASNSTFRDVEVVFFESRRAKMTNDVLGRVTSASIGPRARMDFGLRSPAGQIAGGVCIRYLLPDGTMFSEFREFTYRFSNTDPEFDLRLVGQNSGAGNIVPECRAVF